MLIVYLILTASRVWAGVCDFSLLGELADPRDPGLVMIGKGKAYSSHVQREIEAALPEGLPMHRFEMRDSLWVRDWFPILNVRDGELIAHKFRPSTTYGIGAQNELLREIAKFHPRVVDVKVILDVGNFISDGKRIFIAMGPALRQLNLEAFKLDVAGFTKRIEDAFGLPVTLLPALAGEQTGHVDVIMTHLGGGKFLVADSRDRVRKLGLDKTAAELRGLGYEVIRIMNGGADAFGREEAYTYTNSLLVGNRALVPVYGVMWPGLSGDDEAALKIYREAGFEVFPIRMNATATSGGMVHCLTRGLPRAVTDAFPPEQLLLSHCH